MLHVLTSCFDTLRCSLFVLKTVFRQNQMYIFSFLARSLSSSKYITCCIKLEMSHECKQMRFEPWMGFMLFILLASGCICSDCTPNYYISSVFLVERLHNSISDLHYSVIWLLLCMSSAEWIMIVLAELSMPVVVCGRMSSPSQLSMMRAREGKKQCVVAHSIDKKVRKLTGLLGNNSCQISSG